MKKKWLIGGVAAVLVTLKAGSKARGARVVIAVDLRLAGRMAKAVAKAVA